MKIRNLLGVLLVTSAMGCGLIRPATGETPTLMTNDAAQASTNNGKVVCEEQPQIGSHIPTKTCRTVEEAAKDREDAQKALNTPRVQSTSK